MSALETLWLWLQGRSSRTETGPDSADSVGNVDDDGATPGADRRTTDDEARTLRNHRYRAGPWQMK